MSASSARNRTLGYRIRGVLALIAIVPLLGAGWFATIELSEANTEKAQVDFVDRSVDRLIGLTELRTLLLEERNWVVGLISIDEIGVSADVVRDITGLDIPSEVAQSVVAVDELITQLGLSEVAIELEAIRSQSDRSNTETQDRYRNLEGLVGIEADLLLDAVLSQASGVRDQGALTRSLRIVDAAAAARQAIAAEFNYYFGSQFLDSSESVGQLAALVGEGAIRADALNQLGRLAEEGSNTRVALDAIEASPDGETFDDSIDELIASNLMGEGTTAGLGVILTDIQGIAARFESASDAIDGYVALVAAAGEDLNQSSAQATSAVQSRYARALAALAGLAAISILVALAASRAVARPIRLLGIAAHRISAGQAADELVAEIGPIEVRQAVKAINEAGAHLALAESQALALAKGDLENASLRVRSSGALGASLQTAVQTLAVSLKEREEFRRRMTHEATHDGLTHLPNRNASLAQLERGLARTSRGNRRLATFFIDLDGFKDINDTNGHQAGDIVLRATAQRLAATVRDGDHIGRLGGDEFLVIAEPVVDEVEAVELARRLGEALTTSVMIDGDEVEVRVSIGIALSNADTANAQDLLRDADLAVYQAKELGGNRAELCDESLRARLIARADLEQALRGAIVDDEFVLYYQTIVDPKQDEVVGYEALLRWDRPGQGMVPPDDFIPFAERSDLIYAVDRWVLRSVARQIVSWDAADTSRSVPISINVSGRSLAQPDFVATVLDAFDEFGIDTARIVIEVTESALLDDLGTAAGKLEQLRDRGIKIAIDDFGTGYTSLAHLKSLPVDILKIDRSFTNDESASSLVQLIIDTGHLLGATITAEGIETELQAAQLSEMGSDDLQGYFFGRPKPARELAPLAFLPSAELSASPSSSEETGDGERPDSPRAMTA